MCGFVRRWQPISVVLNTCLFLPCLLKTLLHFWKNTVVGRPGKGHSLYGYVCAIADLIPDLQNLQNLSEDFLVIHLWGIRAFLKPHLLKMLLSALRNVVSCFWRYHLSPLCQFDWDYKLYCKKLQSQKHVKILQSYMSRLAWLGHLSWASPSTSDTILLFHLAYWSGVQNTRSA